MAKNMLKIKKYFKFYAVFVLMLASFLLVSCFGVSTGEISNLDFSDGLTQPSSDDLDDYYSSVLILSDPGHEGEYYDNATGEVMDFYSLLDRQLSTLSQQLIYALNFVYGDHTQRVSILDVGNSVDGWSDSVDISIVGNALLTDNAFGAVSQILFSDASHQSAVAGFNGVEINNNPFNYSNAIKGGYVYQREEDNSGAFTSTLRPEDRWKYDGQLEDNAKIKNDLAQLIVDGSTENIDKVGVSYESALQRIDHLGFEGSETDLIASYVKSFVIGESQVNLDNQRRSIFVDNRVVVNPTTYSFNADGHYFKNYDFVVDMIVQRATLLASGGSYISAGSEVDDGSFVIYPKMARIAIDVFKPSEISAKLNEGLEEEMDYSNIEVNENPIFDEPRKILSFIFLPKVSQDLQDRFKAELDDDDSVNSNDEIYNQLDMFSIGSFSIGVKSSVESEYVNDFVDFIVRYSFLINVDGEELFSGYIDNDGYLDPEENTIIPGVNDDLNSADYFPNKNDVVVYGNKYSSADAIADYDMKKTISTDDEIVKISEYEGVAILDENGNLSAEIFHESDGLAYLKVWNNVFDITEKVEGVGVNAAFMGEKNFFQVFINFFEKNAPDKTIATQFLWLMFLSTTPC